MMSPVGGRRYLSRLIAGIANAIVIPQARTAIPQRGDFFAKYRRLQIWTSTRPIHDDRAADARRAAYTAPSYSRLGRDAIQARLAARS